MDFIEEKASGKIHWKERKIHEIIKILTKVDNPNSQVLTEVCWRLWRSFLLLTQKENNVYIVKGDRKLDDSIESKVLSMVFALATEIERDFISSRTK